MQKGYKMEDLSISQTAVKWNLSIRRIRRLCTEGRIECTCKVGPYRLTPEDAEKPKDGSVKSGMYAKLQKRENDG